MTSNNHEMAGVDMSINQTDVEGLVNMFLYHVKTNKVCQKNLNDFLKTKFSNIDLGISKTNTELEKMTKHIYGISHLNNKNKISYKLGEQDYKAEFFENMEKRISNIESIIMKLEKKIDTLVENRMIGSVLTNKIEMRNKRTAENDLYDPSFVLKQMKYTCKPTTEEEEIGNSLRKSFSFPTDNNNIVSRDGISKKQVIVSKVGSNNEIQTIVEINNPYFDRTVMAHKESEKNLILSFDNSSAMYNEALERLNEKTTDKVILECMNKLASCKNTTCVNRNNNMKWSLENGTKSVSTEEVNNFKKFFKKSNDNEKDNNHSIAFQCASEYGLKCFEVFANTSNKTSIKNISELEKSIYREIKPKKLKKYKNQCMLFLLNQKVYKFDTVGKMQYLFFNHRVLKIVFMFLVEVDTSTSFMIVPLCRKSAIRKDCEKSVKFVHYSTNDNTQLRTDCIIEFKNQDETSDFFSFIDNEIFEHENLRHEKRFNLLH